MTQTKTSIVLSETHTGDKCGVVVSGPERASDVAQFLVADRSAGFELTPLPDDEYRIDYKPEHHASVMENFGKIRPIDRPWSLERGLTPDGVRAETKGKGGVEIHAGGFCLGVWVDHEHDGFSPRMARTIHRANCLPRIVEAAEDLLASARDMGECFVTEGHEKYDPENPEQMWSDWTELQEAVDEYRKGESHVGL